MLTNQLLYLIDEGAVSASESLIGTDYSVIANDMNIRKWREEHTLSTQVLIQPRHVSFKIPTLEDCLQSAQEVIQNEHLLVLLVWRLIHSRSLSLLESSAHVLYILCKTDVMTELCHSSIHDMLCLTLCDALLQEDKQTKKRFFESSITLTNDIMYVLSVLVESDSIDAILPLEFVYLLPEIMMDRIMSLNISICSLHILNILIAQAVRSEPIAIDSVQAALHVSSQPDLTPYDDFGMGPFPSSPIEGFDESPMKITRGYK